MRIPPVRLVPLWCAALLVACAGSQEKPDNAQWETREGMRGMGQEEEEDDEPISTTVGSGDTFDWVGVRHDLALNLAMAKVATCSCLAVGVGAPNDPQFTWLGPRPEMRSQKLALAISAAGVECAGGAENPMDRRPSIAAVNREGNDLFIEVEEVASDRPVATGAIVDAPAPGGGIYIKPRGKKLPYAKRDGKNLCKVK